MKKIYILEVVFYPYGSNKYAFSSAEKAEEFRRKNVDASHNIYIHDVGTETVPEGISTFDYCYESGLPLDHTCI
jgi:hypothetical protein